MNEPRVQRRLAAIMAADLSETPASGIRVQACGDCHLMNFGAFATPERDIIFDMSDTNGCGYSLCFLVLLIPHQGNVSYLSSRELLKHIGYGIRRVRKS